MRYSSTLASTALVAGAAAQNYLGFNSGATFADRSAKFKADWVAEFTTAQNLVNAPGTFNAVRLYTNIQAYSVDDPIQAFDAAVETKTKILLGIWTSGVTDINKELSALKKAVDSKGKAFTDLIIGMSVGSEDLYRDSVTGRTNKAGVGNGPSAIAGFIADYRKAFAGTALAGVPVGHVDTWDVWGNSSNKVVLDAIDFIGVDEYPYYESGKGNDIKNAGRLFDRAFDATIAAANGKPVWLTETGWPTTGPNWDLAVPSVENAKYYWNEIGCRKLFNKVPTFWYTLRDANPDNKMKFAITNELSTTPLFDLTCPTTFDTPSQTASPTGVPSPNPNTNSSSGGSPSSPTTPTTGSPSQPGPSGNGAASTKFHSGAVYAGLALVAGCLALI